jgi:hypothetical protein
VAIDFVVMTHIDPPTNGSSLVGGGVQFSSIFHGRLGLADCLLKTYGYIYGCLMAECE